MIFHVVLPVSYYERVGNTTFNTVAVIDADGTVLGQYRKTAHSGRPFLSGKVLFHARATPASAYGTPPMPKIGVGICWDQWFPESARCMALHGRGAAVLPDGDWFRADS